ncbi:MAG: hypothetical protein IPP56_01990 [Bacteroidetes bacterium]|nr:hypothetical protein [Bacteroidota bacterium]
MNIIENNPYRTVGLLVGASAAQQNRHITRIPLYIDSGDAIPEEFTTYSFPTLGEINLTSQNVSDASLKLDHYSDKMNAALFWFYNGNPITDDPAFEALKDGDTDTAISIWRKLAYDSEDDSYNEITKRNSSAFHNLSTLYLQEYGIDEDTLHLKLLFLESDFSNELKNKATDENFKISKKELQLLFLNTLTEEKDFETSELIESISNIEFSAKEDFLKSFVQKPFEQIEKTIGESNNKRKINKANSLNIGKALFEQTSDNLNQLKAILGTTNVRYSSIADKVANEILQCSIDFFNHHQENESDLDYFDQAWKLAKLTESIALGKLTKDRIIDSLNTLEEMKEKEITQAIQLLESIKDAYEENKRKIKQQVKELEETDIEIRLGHKTINHRAVEDNIKNSIEWQKVNELLATVLSDNSLKKIKESDNNDLKHEFIQLTNWLKENSLKNSTITTIINKYKKIPPKLPFKIISSVVTNTDNKPLFTKIIRYVGLRLDVQVLDEKSITFYIKYIKPNGTTDKSEGTSPAGYTRKETSNLTKHTKSIDFLGWGNKDKCTYDIGVHRIEVYVDEYLIQSKEFTVDLAPSEKLEIELKKAESKMKEINNTQYFKSELSTAQNEMIKIKEWQFLRSQSDKEKQINDQQQKINNLVKRAETEKNSQVNKQQSVINDIKSKIQKAEY